MISKKSMTFEMPEKSPNTFACRAKQSAGYGTGCFDENTYDERLHTRKDQDHAVPSDEREHGQPRVYLALLNGRSQQGRGGYGNEQVETVASTRKEGGVRLSHRNKTDDDVDIEHNSDDAINHNYRLVVPGIRQVFQSEGSNDEGNPEILQVGDPTSPSYRWGAYLYSGLAFPTFAE